MTLKYQKSKENTSQLLIMINSGLTYLMQRQIQKKLVNNSDISNLKKNSSLKTKLAILLTITGLKAEQDKIVKLGNLNFDSSYCPGNFF